MVLYAFNGNPHYITDKYILRRILYFMTLIMILDIHNNSFFIDIFTICTYVS